MGSRGVEAITNYLVISDTIGTAGQPTLEQFADVQAAGYEAVVNLAMPDSPNALPDEGEVVRALGMEYVHIPVAWDSPTPDDLERFFETMTRYLGRRVLVHCALNWRVSSFTFLYRVLCQGVPVEDATGDLLKIWQPNETWQRFIDHILARHGGVEQQSMGDISGCPSDLVVEMMREGDWSAVRAIYQEGISTGNATFETDVPDWQEWDRNHLRVCRLVATSRGQVVGWAALSPVSHRSAYQGVAEVSIYVATPWTGRGVGHLLLDQLIETSERAGIWTLQGGIFPENVVSLRLHESCGFRTVGTRERIGQIDGRWRDVVLMERRSRVAGV